MGEFHYLRQGTDLDTRVYNINFWFLVLITPGNSVYPGITTVNPYSYFKICSGDTHTKL